MDKVDYVYKLLYARVKILKGPRTKILNCKKKTKS